MMEPMKSYKGNYAIKFEERDGKYVIEFDDMPALVFVSFDGHGSTDALLYNGHDSANRTGVTIKSNVHEITTYTEDKYAIGTE